jgi:Protein of unknown function (DUF4235)
MSAKRKNGGRRAFSGMITGAADLAAYHYSRKAVTFGWKRITGKEPPSNPSSPKVPLLEALCWAIVLGIGVEATRMLTERYVTWGLRHGEAGEEG